MNENHNSLPERRTSRLGCQRENGQARAGTLGRQDLINRYHLTQPEKQNMNFELLEHTVTTLAKFFQIEETSTGVEKLMRLLYKIKSKIEDSWVDILNLKAVMVVFSIHKDFSLKYKKESLSFFVSSDHDILIKPRNDFAFL